VTRCVFCAHTTWNVVLVINWTVCLHCADYNNIKTIDLWLKTQPFRVTFHDILFRIALTCQCRLSVVCPTPRGIPGAPGMQLPTPESPGVKIMDGVGFPTTNPKSNLYLVAVRYGSLAGCWVGVVEGALNWTRVNCRDAAGCGWVRRCRLWCIIA